MLSHQKKFSDEVKKSVDRNKKITKIQSITPSQLLSKLTAKESFADIKPHLSLEFFPLEMCSHLSALMRLEYKTLEKIDKETVKNCVEHLVQQMKDDYQPLLEILSDRSQYDGHTLATLGSFLADNDVLITLLKVLPIPKNPLSSSNKKIIDFCSTAIKDTANQFVSSTPLMFAASGTSFNHLQLIELLLFHGASAKTTMVNEKRQRDIYRGKAVNRYGWTALDCAFEAYHLSSIKDETSFAIIQRLMAAFPLPLGAEAPWAKLSLYFLHKHSYMSVEDRNTLMEKVGSFLKLPARDVNSLSQVTSPKKDKKRRRKSSSLDAAVESTSPFDLLVNVATSSAHFLDASDFTLSSSAASNLTSDFSSTVSWTSPPTGCSSAPIKLNQALREQTLQMMKEITSQEPIVNFFQKMPLLLEKIKKLLHPFLMGNVASKKSMDESIIELKKLCEEFKKFARFYEVLPMTNHDEKMNNITCFSLSNLLMKPDISMLMEFFTSKSNYKKLEIIINNEDMHKAQFEIALVMKDAKAGQYIASLLGDIESICFQLEHTSREVHECHAYQGISASNNTAISIPTVRSALVTLSFTSSMSASTSMTDEETNGRKMKLSPSSNRPASY